MQLLEYHLQEKVIQLVAKKPNLSMEQIGKELGMGRTSAYKVVRSLRDLGILEHVVEGTMENEL